MGPAVGLLGADLRGTTTTSTASRRDRDQAQVHSRTEPRTWPNSKTDVAIAAKGFMSTPAKRARGHAMRAILCTLLKVERCVIVHGAPWWPWNEPPQDLKKLNEPAGDYCLRQIEENHWVGVWRTEAVVNDDSPPPQLAYRVVDQH